MINEVDYNHPNHPDKKLKRMLEKAEKIVQIVLGDEDLLYIYVDPGSMPPNKAMKYASKIRDEFVAELPDTKIIVSTRNLKFTAITKKQEFGEKLAGNIK